MRYLFGGKTVIYAGVFVNQEIRGMSHLQCSGFCRMPATATAFATKDSKVTKNGVKM